MVSKLGSIPGGWGRETEGEGIDIEAIDNAGIECTSAPLETTEFTCEGISDVTAGIGGAAVIGTASDIGGAGDCSTGLLETLGSGCWGVVVGAVVGLFS